ncbi:MAG: lytic transglycosylase domain-containing protein, partial [Armatimonadetes bacterium]|nr:lytic transglycosylase domain-containing protein [Armatimonadota bacterium]
AAPPAPDPNAAEAVAVARLERFISGRNRGVGAGERRLIATEIIRWARYHGMRWEFFAALIAAESNFNRRAVSSAGALGLGQLMPFNCSAYGLSDPFDIKQNLYGAGMHIRGILDKYRSRSASDQFQLTLATYNAGAGAVAKHGGVPPYNETINYIRKVADLYLRLCNAG